METFGTLVSEVDAFSVSPEWRKGDGPIMGPKSERNVQVFQTGWDGWGSEGGNFKDLHALISEHH